MAIAWMRLLEKARRDSQRILTKWIQNIRWNFFKPLNALGLKLNTGTSGITKGHQKRTKFGWKGNHEEEEQGLKFPWRQIRKMFHQMTIVKAMCGRLLSRPAISFVGFSCFSLLILFLLQIPQKPACPPSHNFYWVITSSRLHLVNRVALESIFLHHPTAILSHWQTHQRQRLWKFSF